MSYRYFNKQIDIDQSELNKPLIYFTLFLFKVGLS